MNTSGSSPRNARSASAWTRRLRDNGLSLVLATLFLSFWIAQAVTGWRVHEEEQARHGAPASSFREYLGSGHFWQSTAENWESEFLQMGVYVVFTCFLFQRGSAESKDPDNPSPRTPDRGKYSFLYRHSLSLGFIVLFLISFLIHAFGGWREENESRLDHAEPLIGFGEFLGSATFWFQSFQNWQSEFLAVFSIVVLTIFLRQEGSPESKPLDAPHRHTGS